MPLAQYDRPVAISCPECGGAMREETIGNLTRFQCHIGHAMTAEVMAAAQAEELDKKLSAVLRALNERAALCREIAEKHRKAGNAGAAAAWQQAADEAGAHEPGLRKMFELGWTHPEGRAAETTFETLVRGAK